MPDIVVVIGGIIVAAVMTIGALGWSGIVLYEAYLSWQRPRQERHRPIRE